MSLSKDFYSIYPTRDDIGLSSLFPSIPKTDKTLILDIDQTLLCTYDNEEAFKDLKIMKDKTCLDIKERTYTFKLFDLDGNKGKGVAIELWGVYRPGLKQFLRFCFAYFLHVVIWSAGQYDYVHAICAKMFVGLNQPKAILTQRDCENMNRRYTKPIVKVANILNVDVSTIVILDDRVYTFNPNPDNGILIPEYNPEQKGGNTRESKLSAIRDPDTAFNQFQTWLLKPEIAGCSDMRYITKNIFK